MNWRARVERSILGKNYFDSDSKVYYLGFDKCVKKVVDKCRIKYSGFRDMKHSNGNTFNTSKTFNVNGAIYRVALNYIPNQSGKLQRNRNRESHQAIKIYEKKHIYKSFDDVPKHLDRKICYRSTSENGDKVVVWEFVKVVRSPFTVKRCKLHRI